MHSQRALGEWITQREAFKAEEALESMANELDLESPFASWKRKTIHGWAERDPSSWPGLLKG
jgi:hypothetical protein